MAGIGEWSFLTEHQLKAAFDEACAGGKDFLIKMTCTSQGLPWAPEGAPSGLAIEMIDFTEVTEAVRLDTLMEDVRAIYKKYDSMKIEAVYRLDCPFEQAVAGTKDDLSLPLIKLGKQFALEAAQAKWEDLPWYKKLFTERPKMEHEPS